MKISQITREKLSTMKDNENFNDELTQVQKDMKEIEVKINELEIKKCDK